MFTFCGERNDRDFEKNMFSQETGFMRWWVLFQDGFMIVSAVILLKYGLIRKARRFIFQLMNHRFVLLHRHLSYDEDGSIGHIESYRCVLVRFTILFHIKILLF
jgi:hypothetical protein